MREGLENGRDERHIHIATYLPLQLLGQRPDIVNIVRKGIHGIRRSMRRLAMPRKINTYHPQTRCGQRRGKTIKCIGIIQPPVQGEDRRSRGRTPGFGCDH